MLGDNVQGDQFAFDFHFGDSQVRSASFAPTPGSGGKGIFSCSVEPLTNEAVAALERAARRHTPIRLMFKQPMLLDFVALERKGPQSVRIVGEVIYDPMKA
jgi:hypothetical protein